MTRGFSWGGQLKITEVLKRQISEDYVEHWMALFRDSLRRTIKGRKTRQQLVEYCVVLIGNEMAEKKYRLFGKTCKGNLKEVL